MFVKFANRLAEDLTQIRHMLPLEDEYQGEIPRLVIKALRRPIGQECKEKIQDEIVALIARYLDGTNDRGNHKQRGRNMDMIARLNFLRKALSKNDVLRVEFGTDLERLQSEMNFRWKGMH